MSRFIIHFSPDEDTDDSIVLLGTPQEVYAAFLKYCDERGLDIDIINPWSEEEE